MTVIRLIKKYHTLVFITSLHTKPSNEGPIPKSVGNFELTMKSENESFFITRNTWCNRPLEKPFLNTFVKVSTSEHCSLKEIKHILLMFGGSS